jgi:hypothetical protein
MKTFKQYLEERVLSIGLNPKHEKHRKEYEDQMHDVLKKSYETLDGGYGGHGAGTKEESDAIRSDIRNPDHIIKAVRRGSNITSVTIYKKRHGRKSIAIGTNKTEQGKKDVIKTMKDDNKMKRSWSEVSGAPEAIKRKIGFPVVSSNRASELTGKDDVRVIDKERYARKIGKDEHEKVILGYPKKET